MAESEDWMLKKNIDLQELQQRISNMEEDHLGRIFKQWQQVGAVLNEERAQRRQKLLAKRPCDELPTYTIPPEVLRQMIPFLTAQEMGRLFLLTGKYLVLVLGEEMVWQAICQKKYPNLRTISNYHWHFLQRQKPVLMASEKPVQLAPPTSSWRGWTLVVDVWRRRELVLSQTINNLEDFLHQATMMVDLDIPIEVGTLPRQRCRGWYLPDQYDGWRARVQLFDNDDSSSSSASHVLVDTSFSLWRGWSKFGELTFLQKERTTGLAMSNRGQWLEHRIVCAKKSQRWQGYLGLQSKLILICEESSHPSNHRDGPDDVNSESVVQFDFVKMRFEAIRLHENSDGKIQHYLFRKDQAWQNHGVELLHLLEELQ